MFFVKNFFNNSRKRIPNRPLTFGHYDGSDFKIQTSINSNGFASITKYSNSYSYDTIFILRNFLNETIKIQEIGQPTIHLENGWKIMLKVGDIIIFNDDSQFVITEETPAHNYFRELN